jgi:hypothetical protein
MQVPFLEQRYCGPGSSSREVQLIDLSHFEPKDGKEQKTCFYLGDEFGGLNYRLRKEPCTGI